VNKCINCNTNTKRARFCTRLCYNNYRKKGKPEKVNTKALHTCIKCQIEFYPTRNTKGMYCSYDCSNGVKSVRHALVCKCCGKEFEINNIAEIKRGHYQYCSGECRKRKYNINEKFFDDINQSSAYWLGYIWSVIYDNRYNTVTLISKKEQLERFNLALNSNYPIKKSINDLSTLKITSLTILNRLVDMGLRHDLYLEVPPIPTIYYKDFIRGYFDSDNGYHYKDYGKDVITMHGKSSKMMRFISDYINGKLVSNNGEWAVISFDFQKISGTPNYHEKWMKFNI